MTAMFIVLVELAMMQPPEASHAVAHKKMEKQILMDRHGFGARRTLLMLGILSCVALAACGRRRKTDQVTPMQRINVARAAEASGDLGLARVMYAATLEVTRDREIELQAADGLARVGDPASALAALDAILARSPNDLDTRRRAGSLRVSNGQPEDGARDLRLVLAARPNDDTSRLNLGVALDMMGRHAEAQPLYRAVLARSPGDVDAANDLALSLMLSGQRYAARAVLAPFLGRADLDPRMRATVNLVESERAAGTSSGPIPLYPASR